ncbi:MAG: VanZ family protein [Candidatus Marivariicella framensis]|jgi:VanZ family protein|tara:strand:- start:997 stop:1371 length:375 start_codon:yes stop_codon:yes gene_type:complete
MNTEKINWQFVSVLNFLTIIYLSFFIMPGSDEFSPIIPHLDKIGHFILYGFQAVSLSMYFRKYFFENPNTIVFTICLIVGVIIEFSQPVLTNNRVFDFLDIIANLSGVLTSLIILKLLIKKRDK